MPVAFPEGCSGNSPGRVPRPLKRLGAEISAPLTLRLQGTSGDRIGATAARSDPGKTSLFHARGTPPAPPPARTAFRVGALGRSRARLGGALDVNLFASYHCGNSRSPERGIIRRSRDPWAFMKE